jgi:hypothetical protein
LVQSALYIVGKSSVGGEDHYFVVVACFHDCLCLLLLMD